MVGRKFCGYKIIVVKRKFCGYKITAVKRKPCGYKITLCLEEKFCLQDSTWLEYPSESSMREASYYALAFSLDLSYALISRKHQTHV